MQRVHAQQVRVIHFSASQEHCGLDLAIIHNCHAPSVHVPGGQGLRVDLHNCRMSWRTLELAEHNSPVQGRHRRPRWREVCGKTDAIVLGSTD